MYKNIITITLHDDLVHTYSIREWEELLVGSDAVHEEELPLTYERVAEVLAGEYWQYGTGYLNSNYNLHLSIACIGCDEVIMHIPQVKFDVKVEEVQVMQIGDGNVQHNTF